VSPGQNAVGAGTVGSPEDRKVSPGKIVFAAGTVGSPADRQVSPGKIVFAAGTVESPEVTTAALLLARHKQATLSQDNSVQRWSSGCHNLAEG